MPYDDDAGRTDNEEHALDVVKRVLKGKGKRKGVFYLATSPDETSIIIERFVKDSTGVKTLARGNKMRKAMDGSVGIVRGILEGGEDRKISFVASLKKGTTLKSAKRKLWQQLASRESSKGTLFSKLVKKASFRDIEGTEDAENEAGTAIEESVQGEGDDYLSEADLRELGLVEEETAELKTLEDALAGSVETLAAALKAEADEDALRAGLEAQSLRAASFRQQLLSYGGSGISANRRAELLVQVDSILAGVKALKLDGTDPFPELMERVSATDAVLLDIVAAQRAQLDRTFGHRTLGLEAEYDKAPVFTPTELLEDHTVVFEQHLNGQLIVEYCFETQGAGHGYSGTLEAITKPVDGDTEEGRQALRAMCEGIDAVKSVFLANQTVLAVTKIPPLLTAAVNTPDSVFSVGSGLPDDLQITPKPGVVKCPQVNATHSMQHLQDMFAKGDPFGSASKTAMMQDAALEADKVFTALAHDKRELLEGSHTLGPRLKGLLTLLVQYVQRVALEHKKSAPDARGWKKASYKLPDPPGGHVDQSWYYDKDRLCLLPKTPLPQLAQDGGITDKELALLRAEQGTLLAEIDRILAYQDAKLNHNAKTDPGTSYRNTVTDLVKRMLGTGKGAARPMPPKPATSRGHAPPPPGDEPTKYPEPSPTPKTWGTVPLPGDEPQTGTVAHDDWAERKRVYDAWNESRIRWWKWNNFEKSFTRLHADWQTHQDLWDAWVATWKPGPDAAAWDAWDAWMSDQRHHWGWMIGDGGVHDIEQRDSSGLRVATEYRMLSGAPPMQTTADTVMDAFTELKEETARETAEGLFLEFFDLKGDALVRYAESTEETLAKVYSDDALTAAYLKETYATADDATRIEMVGKMRTSRPLAYLVHPAFDYQTLTFKNEALRKAVYDQLATLSDGEMVEFAEFMPLGYSSPESIRLLEWMVHSPRARDVLLNTDKTADLLVRSISYSPNPKVELASLRVAGGLDGSWKASWAVDDFEQLTALPEEKTGFVKRYLTDRPF